MHIKPKKIIIVDIIKNIKNVSEPEKLRSLTSWLYNAALSFKA
jgi:hypothetical protein